MAGTDCTMVYVKIPSSAALPATSANVAKYCGTVLANTNDATVASPVICKCTYIIALAMCDGIIDNF